MFNRCSKRRTPRGGCPDPSVKIQLWFSQNLSSLNRLHTVSFSTWRTKSASQLPNCITSGSQIEGIAYPPVPIFRQFISSPLSTIVMFPTIVPRFFANTCNSSRRLPSETSRSSRTVSLSPCSSNVFSFVPVMV